MCLKNKWYIYCKRLVIMMINKRLAPDSVIRLYCLHSKKYSLASGEEADPKSVAFMSSMRKTQTHIWAQ